ncbi:MAG TPA: EamA family transporter, partial [Myxococcota bacterium]|nr:EamA family transporter [Myxococcota bacterium]
MFAADLALIAMTLLWGASFLVTKDLLAEVAPDVLLALRFAVAALALALVRPRALLRPRGDVWRAGAVLGVALYVSFALQTYGLAYTTPAPTPIPTGSRRSGSHFSPGPRSTRGSGAATSSRCSARSASRFISCCSAGSPQA